MALPRRGRLPGIAAAYRPTLRSPGIGRPHADLEAAALIIARAAEEVWDADEAAADVLDRPEVLGLEYLGPDAATIRVQGKTRPGAQWRVSRLLRVRIAEALADAWALSCPRRTTSARVAPGGRGGRS